MPELAPITLADMRRIRTCPDWRKPDCGCVWGNCAQGRGHDGVVQPAQCLACPDCPPAEAPAPVVVVVGAGGDMGPAEAHDPASGTTTTTTAPAMVDESPADNTPSPAGRCAACPIKDLPTCAGIHDGPGACSADRTPRLVNRSRFYSSLHYDWPRKPKPAPPPPPAGRVVIRAEINGFSGYGQMVAALGDELAAAGVPVAFRPIGAPAAHFIGTPAATLARVDGHAPEPHELLIAPPDHGETPGRRTLRVSMWESSRIGPAAAEGIDKCARLVVPCRWNAEGFAASGVTIPVDVIPLGVDLATFRPRRDDRPPGPFTVGCAGRTAHGGVRKGLDDVIAAFREAFGDDPGVRLRVKCWPDCAVADPGDPRVAIERDPLTADGLADWYRSLDVFASASRSEGFGLQPLQALACGVPVVATAFGGHAEYLDGRVGYPVAWDDEPAEGVYAGLGTWARPRPADLVARLREARADPGRAAKGIEARARAMGFPWARTAHGLRRSLAAAGTHADPGPSLGAAVIVRDFALLDRALGSVRGAVDRVVVGVDDRAEARVRDWLDAEGIAWFSFAFSGFAAAYNRAAEAVGTDWVLSLDADETIDPAGLRDLIARGEAEGVDAWTLPRRHWWDLEGTREHAGPWPDRQAKLRRRGVGFRWQAHQELEPGRRVADADGPVVEHFNFALRTPEDWARVNAEYGAQLRADVAAGRAWTGDAAAVSA